jgi:phospholipid/cholesterol/gamma-HCH transport system permease protein
MFPFRAMEYIGGKVLQSATITYDYMKHLALTLRGMTRLRPGQVLDSCVSTGINALPILCLTGFLMGLILAMRTTTQLQKFGASIYVADLVATSMTRAIGPLMTGILVAGRSSSAFAAEVGTRKINDEVAALETMSLDVHTYLFSPKFLATVMVMPFISLVTSLIGIFGGFMYSVTGFLVTPREYMFQTLQAIHYSDFLTGSFKAMVFGAIIALVGCVKGFGVVRGAPQVGKAARGSVVLSIVLIIIADAIFTAIFQT